MFSFQTLLAGGSADVSPPIPAPAPALAPDPAPTPASASVISNTVGEPSVGVCVPRVLRYVYTPCTSSKQVNTTPITHYKTDFKERNGGKI